VLELDFFADKGSVPALHDPPKFTGGIMKCYLEGGHPAEPNWFYKGTDVYEKNIKFFLTGLADHYHQMTSNHLLTVAQYASGSSGIYHVCLMNQNCTPLFSDEGLNAFSRALMNDDSHLEEVFGDTHMSIIARHDMELRICMR